ncbi:hypothetical protein KKG45_01970, partial [bacterium]|nr:hypothetical protein [bacterium]
MRIVTARLRRYAIPLRDVFATSRGSLSRREGVIVELVDSEGRTGLGDVAPLPGFSPEGLADAETAASRLCAGLRELEFDDHRTCLGEVLDRLPALRGCPASTRCGLDTALADLAAQAARRPLARLLGDDAAGAVAYNTVLPAGATRRDLEAACQPGIGIVKMKVGALAPEDDRRRIEALLDGLPPQVRLRLDANGAWNPQQALTALAGLPARRIEFVEEPLAPQHADALDDVHRRCGLAFALDETVFDP